MLAAAFMCALVPCQAEPVSKPIVRPLTTADAIAELPGVRGKVIALGDLDGDKSPDLAAAGVEGSSPTIDVYSARDGKLVRRLWKADGSGGWGAELIWDAGSDVNEDGIPDVLIGLPLASAEDRRGAVLVVSGADGRTLHQFRGDEAADFLGTSVALVGDLNGDGLADFVVGSAQADPTAKLVPFEDVVGHGSSSQEGDYLVFRDGTKRQLADVLQQGMAQRSTRPGRVSARSGRNGSELWHVDGASAGHAFGSSLRAVGDFDRDGIGDVLAACDRRSPKPMTLISGATGGVIAHLEHDHGPAGPAGDFDGDGVPDLHFDFQALNSTMRGNVRVVSGASFKSLASLPNPDWGGEFGMTAALGDLDGDGFAELALGEPNFHILGPGNPGFAGTAAPDLSKLSLAQALALPSNPCCMSYESGCLLVYSGRTRSVIWGVFGMPGTMQGIGFQACALPDVSGDGHPDLVVAGGGCSYVLPGPGKPDH